MISEFAFVKMRKTRVQEMIEQKLRGAESVMTVISHIDAYLSSTQLGITLASIGLGFIGEEFVQALFESTFPHLPNVVAISFILSYTVVTFSHVVLGELVPKSISIQKSELAARFAAPILIWFNRITSPILWILNVLTVAVLALFKLKPAKEGLSPIYSEEELKMIIQESSTRGELEKFESDLIYRIFDFTDTPARSILTPRYKIVGVEINDTFEDVIRKSKESGFSRFPIFEGKIDNIKGLLHIKDVIATIYDAEHVSDESINSIKVADIVRDVIIAHELKPVDDLLKEMQSKHIQVAILVDEWGSVEGIVTIEDIVEAIVGPIMDEFDAHQSEYISQRFENKFVINAQISIDDFNNIIKDEEIKIESMESVTLAGYLLEIVESKIPKTGDIIADGRIGYKILGVKNNRIEKVEVEIHPIKSDSMVKPNGIFDE